MAFTIERFLCKFSLNEGFYLITQALWGAIHEQSNTVVTVKTKYTDIGVTGQSSITNDPMMAEALTKVVELVEIGQQIQSVYAFHLLSALKQSEHEIDDQLNEIAGYMESIIQSRQREAEKLRKVQ